VGDLLEEGGMYNSQEREIEFLRVYNHSMFTSQSRATSMNQRWKTARRFLTFLLIEVLYCTSGSIFGQWKLLSPFCCTFSRPILTYPMLAVFHAINSQSTGTISPQHLSNIGIQSIHRITAQIRKVIIDIQLALLDTSTTSSGWGSTIGH